MRILLPGYLLLMLCLFSQLSYASAPAADTLTPTATNITDDRALRLLTTDPVYTENWINNVTFTYDNVRAVDLPEQTSIPVLQPGEKFTATWYGKLSSGYKWRWGRQHHGVDLGLKTGDPIYAAWDGVVRYAQWNKSGYGNCVVIRHRNGLETLYAHMSKLLVNPNQYVSSGEMIGLGGSTGNSTGPHLHFEIRYKDFSINPELIIDYNTRTLKLDTFQFIRSNISGTRYSGDINAKQTVAAPEQIITPQPIIADSAKNIPVTTTMPVSQPVVNTPPPTVEPAATTTVPKNEKKEVASVKTTSATSSKTEKKEVTAKNELAKKKEADKKKELAKKKEAAKKKSATTYIIQKGDTYTSISRRTGVSIATLKKLNPTQIETLLRPGSKIRLR